jgi:hypothetical protein
MRPDSTECPYLVPVMADRVWLYPTGAYCRRPDARVRWPSRSRVTCVCSTAAHLLCPSYLASAPPPGHPVSRSAAAR